MLELKHVVALRHGIINGTLSQYLSANRDIYEGIGARMIYRELFFGNSVAEQLLDELQDKPVWDLMIKQCELIDNFNMGIYYQERQLIYHRLLDAFLELNIKNGG